MVREALSADTQAVLSMTRLPGCLKPGDADFGGMKRELKDALIELDNLETLYKVNAVKLRCCLANVWYKLERVSPNSNPAALVQMNAEELQAFMQDPERKRQLLEAIMRGTGFLRLGRTVV